MNDESTDTETDLGTTSVSTSVTLPRIVIPPTQLQSPAKLNSNGSPVKRGMSAKSFSRKSILAEDKLEDINKQLAEVRRLRAETTAGADGRVHGKRVDYSVKPKKSFHHPKLDIVIGEIVYSPYMTKPNEKYSPDTFKMADKLREMKRRGVSFSDVPSSEKPYNERAAKNKFIREVVNFNPGFAPSEHKVNLRASTGNLSSMVGSFSQSTLGSNGFGGGGECKSLLMQSAEARGGPVKFKQQLREGQVPRSPSSRALFADSLTSDGSTGNRCSSRNSSRGGGSATGGTSAKNTSSPLSSSFLTAAPASPAEVKAKARRSKSRGSLGAFDPIAESFAEDRAQPVVVPGTDAVDATAATAAATDIDRTQTDLPPPSAPIAIAPATAAAASDEADGYAADGFEEHQALEEEEAAASRPAVVVLIDSDIAEEEEDYVADDFAPEGDQETAEAVEAAVEDMALAEQVESCVSPPAIEEEAHCIDGPRATSAAEEVLDEVENECTPPALSSSSLSSGAGKQDEKAAESPIMMMTSPPPPEEAEVVEDSHSDVPTTALDGSDEQPMVSPLFAADYI